MSSIVTENAMEERYQEPTALHLPRKTIWGWGEKVAAVLHFKPGDRLEPVVERLGGTIIRTATGEGVIGTDASLYVDGPDRFRVFMAPWSGAERERFTLAHEIGHYILHSKFGKKRICAARYGSDRVEWEANWFAAAFLMPAQLFSKIWDRYDRDEYRVAAYFGVSPSAVGVRRETLGL